MTRSRRGPSTPLVRLAVLLACLVAASWLVALQASAQSWAGQGRMSGQVLDEHEQPLAGAQVEVRLGDHGGPEAVVTDERGRWSILGLAPGRWRIVIRADGYLQSEGQIDVGAGPGAPSRIVLRPLSENVGLFAETPGGVLEFVSKGNSLLDQGQATEAREEYRKALPYLPEDERVEVLHAVARTYMQDRDLDGADRALREALVYRPGDETSRSLFTRLLSAFGRGEEAESWLARLDAEGADALRGELELVSPSSAAAPAAGPAELPVELPVVDEERHRVGSYRLRLAEGSPLSSLDVFVERTGAARSDILELDPRAGRYDLAQETFEVVVPGSYRSVADGGEPWGLFVWVSPVAYGGVRRPDNLDVLAAKRMLWIGANHSGNQRKIWDRVGLALDAAAAMQRLYDVDPKRIYAAGYSGGGRMATRLGVLYPEVFHGGFMVKGVDFYRPVAMPDKPGAHWPAAFAEPPRATWPQVKERNRYVLLTGENDFNRLQTRTYHRLYRDDGFEYVFYLEQPGADHYSAFGGEVLGRAIDLLDGLTTDTSIPEPQTP